jgi:hypothetical protein
MTAGPGRYPAARCLVPGTATTASRTRPAASREGAFPTFTVSPSPAPACQNSDEASREQRDCQVLSGAAGAVDRHAVIGTSRADVVHVSMQPGCKSCRLAGCGGYVCRVRRSASPGEQAVSHLHVRDDSSPQFTGGCRGIQTALCTCDRGQGRCCRLVDGCPRRQGNEGQCHGLAKVPAFRRIVTSRVTESEQVNRYPDPARYLPDLVDGKCLLPAQHVRDPALGVSHRQSELFLRPAVRSPDLLQQRREVAARERGGDGRRGPELWRQVSCFGLAHEDRLRQVTPGHF